MTKAFTRTSWAENSTIMMVQRTVTRGEVGRIITYRQGRRYVREELSRISLGACSKHALRERWCCRERKKDKETKSWRDVFGGKENEAAREQRTERSDNRITHRFTANIMLDKRVIAEESDF